MKQLFAGLLAAFLTTAGLAVVTSSAAGATNSPSSASTASSASAATVGAACPYTGCVATRIVRFRVFDARKPGKIRALFKVRTVGNAAPHGRVRIIVKRPGVYRSKTVPYPGNSGMSFFDLRKRTYRATIRFIPNKDTAFAPSSRSTRVRVR